MLLHGGLPDGGQPGTVSARPKLWITLATGMPVPGYRSLCTRCREHHHRAVLVRPPRLPRVHACKSSRLLLHCRATRPQACAYSIPPAEAPHSPLTRHDAIDQARICLRSSEVRSDRLLVPAGRGVLAGRLCCLGYHAGCPGAVTRWSPGRQSRGRLHRPGPGSAPGPRPCCLGDGAAGRTRAGWSWKRPAGCWRFSPASGSPTGSGLVTTGR